MATQFDPIAKDESFNSSESPSRSIADILASMDNKMSAQGASYIINIPTSGYTSGSVTIWGETKTLYSKTITTDKDGSPLTNFTSGMTSDYPINISGSNSDFAKLYAFEIGNGSVTVYMTSAPSVAFNVMIKEG